MAGTEDTKKKKKANAFNVHSEGAERGRGGVPDVFVFAAVGDTVSSAVIVPGYTCRLCKVPFALRAIL